MTDFVIRYSYFDRALGRSGHGEAIVRIQTKGTGAGDAGEGVSKGQDAGEEGTGEDAGEGEGVSKGQTQGEEEGQSQGETIDLDDPEYREAIEQHIKDALTREYPEHNHGQLVVVVTGCSPVATLEGEAESS